MHPEPEPRSASQLIRGNGLELAVVVPTYNERENVLPFLQQLDRVLAGRQWEVLFVDDDSPDGTAEAVREQARQDSRVRLIRRIGRRGLASASIEGMLATTAPFIAVMDADLQHDETILPVMLDRIASESLDLVIASRNVAGGSMGRFVAKRVWLSNLGARISGAVTRCSLSDPMSGFFVVRHEFLNRVAPRLSGVGFKILLDLVASAPGEVRFAEVPYTFRQRLYGESKLDLAVGAEYLYLVIDKLVGSLIPAQFVVYAAVGSIGVAIHLLFLRAFLRDAGLPFSASQTLATGIVIAINFWLNNLFTFRERRFRGLEMIHGFLIYLVGCAIGLLTNLGVARFLVNSGAPWYLAGTFGLSVSAVWNYWVSSVFAWRWRRPKA